MASITKLIVLLFIAFVNADAIVHYQPEQIHLSMSASEDGMVFSWVTPDDTKESIVEYGLKPTELNKSVKSKEAPIKFKPAGSTSSSKRVEYMHRVEILGLEKDTTYYYHVGGTAGWSNIFWFTTFPDFNKDKKEVRLAVFGDMGNENAQSLTALQKETQEGKYHAMIHVGDFAYDLPTDDGQVGDEFMRQIESVAGYVPYMTCNGNHENYYNFSTYRGRFNMPNDKNSEKMFFSFNIGPIHFISFSTEYYYYTHFGWDQITTQYNFIEQDLKEATKPQNRKNQPWIVAYGHRPMYCSNSDRDDCTKDNCRLRVGYPEKKLPGLEDLFFKYNVDVQVYAHEHNYERLFPIFNKKLMNGTGSDPYVNPKGPVHITTGSAGCREHHDPLGKPQYYSAFRSTNYGYNRMFVPNATHMHIQYVSDDKKGAVIDDFWIVSDNHNFH